MRWSVLLISLSKSIAYFNGSNSNLPGPFLSFVIDQGKPVLISCPQQDGDGADGRLLRIHDSGRVHVGMNVPGVIDAEGVSVGMQIVEQEFDRHVQGCL